VNFAEYSLKIEFCRSPKYQIYESDVHVWNVMAFCSLDKKFETKKIT